MAFLVWVKHICILLHTTTRIAVGLMPNKSLVIGSHACFYMSSKHLLPSPHSYLNHTFGTTMQEQEPASFTFTLAS